jgi:hypothetical protein
MVSYLLAPSADPAELTLCHRSTRENQAGKWYIPHSTHRFTWSIEAMVHLTDEVRRVSSIDGGMRTAMRNDLPLAGVWSADGLLPLEASTIT